MTNDTSRVTIHMVASLDGYIAKKDGSISWMDTTDSYEQGVDGEDPEEFLKTIDCYLMGSRTYEHALELSKDFGWAYGHVPTFVLTHRDLPSARESVRFHAGDLQQFVNDRLKPNYANIWMVGGAALTKDFIRLQLADDIRLIILPIILGGGTPFFDLIGLELPLHLKNVTAYKNGMVELWYEIRKEPAD